MADKTAEQLVWLSNWIDNSPANAERDPEALTWHRVAKVAEESGEVIEAMIGSVGGNPRKGTTHNSRDLINELLDVAISALGAVEHLTPNKGYSMALLRAKVAAVVERAGGPA